MIQKVQKAEEIAAAVAADMIAGRLGPGDPVPAVRELARAAGCSPGTAARAHSVLREAGLIEGSPRAHAVVTAEAPERAVAMAARTGGDGAARLSGSDDPALDLLLTLVGPAVERAPAGRGSVAGLGMLAQGAVDAAAVHLRDVGTGRANDPFARRVLGGRPATLVHLWSREQGIVVPQGNPRGITGIADLHGAALATRAPGTGSRLLLSRLLREAGAEPGPGGELCESHLGVAVAVTTGAADAGLAVRAAADAVGAGFVPVEWEDFELAVGAESLGAIAPLIDVLTTPSFRHRLSAMAGYDLSRAGDLREAA
ncbi:molybdate-binding protein [Murinocardiopsis flavida]|uniref:Molybdate-binding protein n=1 Tax=Murinocardiopsis flavida TaxID=645275 RepID=A0A2P8DKH8_9ACTN|nr:substrate-binding domain-containing protein [Murinocardiopsis flavida]PSK97730.1 molybdate-binding protein [Murinocardiopsis flavida]